MELLSCNNVIWNIFIFGEFVLNMPAVIRKIQHRLMYYVAGGNALLSLLYNLLLRTWHLHTTFIVKEITFMSEFTKTFILETQDYATIYQYVNSKNPINFCNKISTTTVYDHCYYFRKWMVFMIPDNSKLKTTIVCSF